MVMAVPHFTDEAVKNIVLSVHSQFNCTLAFIN